MSEISSNFGMESLNVAMLKRSSDNQGQMALALLKVQFKHLNKFRRMLQLLLRFSL